MLSREEVKRLKIEKRELEKKIDMAENTRTIFKGEVTLGTEVKISHASTKVRHMVKSEQEISNKILYNMEMKRHNKTIICILQGTGGRVSKSEKYVGISKCHEDDYFDLGLGCSLAQMRAEEKAMQAEYRRLEREIGGRR